MIDHTAANVPEINHLLVMIATLPKVKGKVGRPKQRPKQLYGDRAYDSKPHRQKLRDQGIRPVFGRRRTEHGSGLGVYRWVVERAIAWLHGFRKLRLVTEKNEHMQDAFLNLAHAIILWRITNASFC